MLCTYKYLHGTVCSYVYNNVCMYNAFMYYIQVVHMEVYIRTCIGTYVCTYIYT